MGLDANDPLPVGISLSDGYEKLRSWYRTNAHVSKDQPAQAALPFIQVLPPANQLSEPEIHAVLLEVVLGQLEWGYHKSDGKYKMAAYAQAALDAAQLPLGLSDEEKQAIKQSNSALLPHLSEHILRQ
jgi:hypothetical protein